MKKKMPAPKKSTVKKTVKKTAPRRSVSKDQGVIFQRIVIISACLVLSFVAVFGMNKGSVTQAVAGVSVARGLFEQATVILPDAPGAVSYNIYFKQEDESTFTNAVRNIPPSVNQYTISYLKKGVNYQYRYAAVDKTGREFLFSEIRPLTDLQSM